VYWKFHHEAPLAGSRLCPTASLVGSKLQGGLSLRTPNHFTRFRPRWRQTQRGTEARDYVDAVVLYITEQNTNIPAFAKDVERL